MKTRRIEVMKTISEDQTVNQNKFVSIEKYGGSVITETDLETAKICLRSANVQKNFEKFFKILLAIS